MNTIADRVAKGAAFLDEHEPPGWDQVIDLDELNIGSSCRCILGQLHGCFSAGLTDLGFFGRDHAWSEIDLGLMWTDAGKGEEAAALTAEWKRVIEARRAS